MEKDPTGPEKIGRDRLGQSRFGHPDLADFGPILANPFLAIVVFARPILANPILAIFRCHCGAAKGGGPNREKVGAMKGGGPKGGDPNGGGPKGGAPKGGVPKGVPQGGVPKGGAPMGGSKGGGPEGWPAQNFALFFLLPPQFFILFSLSFGLFRGILVVF